MPMPPHIDPHLFAQSPLWVKWFIIACLFGYAVCMLAAAYNLLRRK
jgi:hypothetical protein